MNCQQARKQWSRYREGELSPRVERKLIGHLGQCTACRADWERFRARMGALEERSFRTSCHLSVGDIRDQAAKDCPDPAARIWVPAWGVVTAAFVLAFWGWIQWGPHRSREGKPAREVVSYPEGKGHRPQLPLESPPSASEAVPESHPEVAEILLPEEPSPPKSSPPGRREEDPKNAADPPSQHPRPRRFRRPRTRVALSPRSHSEGEREPRDPAGPEPEGPLRDGNGKAPLPPAPSPEPESAYYVVVHRPDGTVGVCGGTTGPGETLEELAQPFHSSYYVKITRPASGETSVLRWERDLTLEGRSENVDLEYEYRPVGEPGAENEGESNAEEDFS